MRRSLAMLVAAVAVLAWLWLRRDEGDAVSPRAAPTTVRPHRGPAGDAALVGRVTRARDGAPIASAQIAIAPTRGHTVFTSSGGDGRWRLATSGRVTVEISAPGYLPRTTEVDAPTSVDAALDEGGTPISGIVSDLEGGPLEGAKVSGLHATAFTGPDGRYQLSVPPGHDELSAEHDDFQHEGRWLNIGDTPLTIDFTLRPGGTIRGIVVDEAGAPLAGMRISDARGWTELGDTGEVTGDDGRFELPGLPSARFLIMASGPGHATAMASEVELELGEQREVRLVAGPAAAILGRVVDDTGAALADVELQLRSQARPGASTATDVTGAFRFDGLIPGTYVLETRAEPLQQIEVGTHNVDGVVVVRPPTTTVAGRVDPPRRVELGISGARGASDEHGAFRLTGVPIGHRRLYAEAPDLFGELVLDVSRIGATGVVIHLIPTAAVDGVALDENGAPFASAHVHVNGIETVADATGKFSLRNLEPGAVRLVASAHRLESAYGRPDAIQVALAPGEHRGGVVLRCARERHRITGVVRGPSGPLRDVDVQARRYDESGSFVSRSVLTGADGRFEIGELDAGAFSVYATAPAGRGTEVVRNVAADRDIAIDIAALPRLSVRVTRGGAPVGEYDLDCRAVGHGDLVMLRVVAADGAYARDVQPGRYQCKAIAETGAVEREVTVDAATTVELALEPYANVTGITVDALRHAPTWCKLTIDGDRDALLIHDEATGRFTNRRAIPGRGNVIVCSRWVPYDVHPGETVDLGEIEVVPPVVGPSGKVGFSILSTGAVVVDDDGPAVRAGLRKDDIVTTIDGVAFTSISSGNRSLLFEEFHVPAGRTYRLGLARGDTIAVTADPIVSWY